MLIAGIASLVMMAPAETSGRAVVLTYHDVIEQRGPGSVWFDCTVIEFRTQVEDLRRRGANFISTRQLEAFLDSGKPLPPRAVAITFADNYRGFLLHAWPILRNRGIPVTMFVHTGYVGSRVGRPKMHWTELGELHRQGVIVASQTVSHPADLTRLNDADLRKEFGASMRVLSDRIDPYGGHRLAYPNGKFDRRTITMAKQVGYQFAYTEVCEPVTRRTERLAIPRYVHTKYRQAWRDLTAGVGSSR
ncbi:MAG: polysaccharide deacetylase family protein [Fimbriimonadaceae bacterium]|nr:polysaccharide deacetylase family protein [Fimbriimonadaceae bacterium]